MPEPKEKQCPRAKSDMTPCYIKHGEMAVGLDTKDHRLCVGCDWYISRIERTDA